MVHFRSPGPYTRSEDGSLAGRRAGRGGRSPSTRVSLSARPVRRKALFTQRPTSHPPAPGAGTGHEASRTLLGVTFKRDTRRGSDQPDPRGMNDFIPELGMNDNKGFRSPSNRGFSVDSVLIKFALSNLVTKPSRVFLFFWSSCSS